jgi:hypothetical protein
VSHPEPKVSQAVRQNTCWYECPTCGPVDPINLPKSLRANPLDNDERPACPECYAPVTVAEGRD